MPLQPTASSGDPLKLSEIIAEFNTSATKASDVGFKGGTYIPTDIVANSSVPTSGTVLFSNFLGSSSVGLGTDVTITAEVGSTFNGTAVTSITFNADGTYDGDTSLTNSGAGSSISGYFTAKKWASGYGAASTPSNYWIYAEKLGGGITLSGTVNTWLQLNATRTWSVTGNKSDEFGQLLMKISASNGGTVIDTMSVVLESYGAGIN